MRKFDRIDYLAIAAFICIVTFAWMAFHKSPQPNLGFAPSSSASTTNSTSSVGSVVATKILSENSSALYRSISNTGTGTLYLWLNSTSSGFTVASGIAVFPSTTYEISDARGNLWLGNVYGLMSNITTTLPYHEQ